MKHLKLFEQFEDGEDWWDNESPFDEKPSTKLKPGDIIVRTWPSGKVTLAEINNRGFFVSLEDYEFEGGVRKGEQYGFAIELNGEPRSYPTRGYNLNPPPIPYRLATEEEKSKLGL